MVKGPKENGRPKARLAKYKSNNGHQGGKMPMVMKDGKKMF